MEGNNSYSKILVIFSIVSLFTTGYIFNYYENAFAAESFQIVPKSLFHLYDNTYLFIFEGCTGNETIRAEDVKIISDIETVSLIEHAEEDRVLPPAECRIFKVLLDVLDPKSISIQVESLAFNYTINLDDVERKKLSFQREDVKMGFPTEITIRIIDLLQSDEILTEKQLQECEDYYDDFVLLKLTDFTSRYLYHNFIGDCVLLFEDPIWETEELERYELLSQRLAELKLQQMEQKAMIYKPVTIRTLSVVELETEGLYLFTFEGCSGDSFVSVDDAMAVSDTEVISLVAEKRKGNIIHEGFCRVFDIKIIAQDPDSIRVLIPDLLTPKAQIQHSVPVDQVVCREGLQLMIKNHGETPACISEATIPKLIERGWGYILQDFDFSVESTTSSDTNSTSTELTNSTSTDLTKTNLKLENQ
ncbi:MAG: hypothetical protein NPMRTH4_1470003 [Nitrosopumilales archaeon]|nr:MAG: hypothetical protein NPMRTH4_1470003 [Nitrosopumilales archaeon]